MTPRLVTVAIVVLVVSAPAVRGQSLELGVHVVGSHWSEFTGTDAALGVRAGWKPMPPVALETEVNWYPGEFPDAAIPVSSRRVEGVIAVTAGPRLSRIRPFVRAGAGFLRTWAATEVFACIAIFPPPLSCLLAGGDTLPTLEIGGGIEFLTTGSTFLRFDAGDRMVKYSGPTLSGGTRQDEGFFGHALKFSLGGGLRF